jgi:ketosteroid isomerase-like protein
MSEENVEIVRQFLEAQTRWLERYWKSPRSAVDAVNRGDLDPDTTKVWSYLHPDVIWNTSEFGTYRGAVEIAGAWDEIFDVTDHYALSVQEIVDCEGDLVFVALDRTAKAKGSGIEATFPIFVVVRVEGALITRADEYAGRAAALEAAGLSE